MRCLTLVAALAVASVGATPAGGAPTGPRANPRVGGQGTIFTISFTASGQDVGPDDFGDALHLRGPASTPCAGPLLGSDILGFGSGPARFLVGPQAPPPAFEDPATSSYRVASPWCPGRYTGWVEEYLGEFGTKDLGHFVFTVRKTRTSPGALLPRTRRLLDHLPPNNRGVRISPRHIAPSTTVTVDFATGLKHDEFLDLRLSSPVRRGCTSVHEFGGVFRPGRGRLRLGSHARERGSNDRAFRVRLCPGRWTGFIGQLAFTFVVHRH